MEQVRRVNQQYVNILVKKILEKHDTAILIDADTILHDVKFFDEINEKQSTVDEINQRQRQIEDELKSGKGNDNELANEYNRIQNDKQQLEQEISDLIKENKQDVHSALIELKKVNKVFQNNLNTLNIYENLVPVDDN